MRRVNGIDETYARVFHPCMRFFLFGRLPASFFIMKGRERMRYHITCEGDMENVQDFCGNLTEFLLSSMQHGLVAMEGKTIYGSLKKEVQALEEKLRSDLLDHPALTRDFSLYLNLRDELEDLQTKQCYFLGHRDSGRVESLLWPREMPHPE